MRRYAPSEDDRILVVFDQNLVALRRDGAERQ